MWLNYLWVFLGCMLVDVSPVPLPPAFMVMVFLQIRFDLPIAPVIAVGVAGSILGRFLLTLYIPKLSGKIFRKAKNEDIQFLGKELCKNGWKSQASILVYSLLPLPTTPLFLAAGMAKLKPLYIIPAFTVGKVISDTAAVLMGEFVAKETEHLVHGLVSWKSITGFILGLVLIFALLFIDWRTLLQERKFKLNFNIWNGTETKNDPSQ